MKRFLVLLFFLAQFLQVSSVRAASQFKTDTQVSFHYDAQGNSQVTQKITLTNITPGLYPSSYNLHLTGLTPQNLTGFDSEGPLKITTRQTDSLSADVQINFNHIAAGLHQTQVFTLNYTGNPAKKNGQVWEIVIPRFNNIQTDDTYVFHLYIPDSLGQTAYISPLPDSITRADPPGFSHLVISSSQNSAASTGIIAAFGDFQSLDFTLHYSISNPGNAAADQSIALPADSAYQKLFYRSISPLPETVTQDPDGNWLAHYSLKPKSSLEITAIGQAHILNSPINPVVLPTDADLARYLQPTTYWPTTDPLIRSLVQKLTTPRQIYDYVVASLEYDPNRIGTLSARKGGVAALSSPLSSTCTEFTDAFITLARAAGIPAREINGYALSTDQHLQPVALITDTLHAWPEYWDATAKTWRWVDPTWAKTTHGLDYFTQMDLNHFAFVTHGLDSTQPLAAGFYKAVSTTAAVRVVPGTYQDYFSRPVETYWHRPFQLFPLISTSSTLDIINSNGTAMYHTPVSTSFSPWLSSANLTATIPVIPPFGKVTQAITFSPHLLPSFSPQSFTIKVGLATVTYNIPENLFSFWYVCIVLITTGSLIALAAFASSSWNLHLQRRRRENSLRR